MFYNIVNHRDPVPRLQPSDITCSLLEDIANFVQDVNRVFGNQLADRVISLLKTAVVTSQSMLIKKYSHAGVFYFIQAPAGHMPASVKRFYAPSTGTNDDLDADVLFRHYMFHKHGYDNDSLRSNLLPYLQDHALSAYRSALQHIVGIVPDATRGGAELQTANFSPLSPDLWQPAIAQQNEAHQGIPIKLTNRFQQSSDLT